MNRERPARGLLFARRRGDAEMSGRASASAARSSAVLAAPSMMRRGLSAGRYTSAFPRELPPPSVQAERSRSLRPALRRARIPAHFDFAQCERRLGLTPVENPDRAVVINPLDRRAVAQLLRQSDRGGVPRIDDAACPRQAASIGPAPRASPRPQSPGHAPSGPASIPPLERSVRARSRAAIPEGPYRPAPARSPGRTPPRRHSRTPSSTRPSATAGSRHLRAGAAGRRSSHRPPDRPTSPPVHRDRRAGDRAASVGRWSGLGSGSGRSCPTA